MIPAAARHRVPTGQVLVPDDDLRTGVVARDAFETNARDSCP